MGREIIPGVVELTREEGRALFDRHARELLGISGEEFLRRYDAGEFDECAEEVVELRMLIPFFREVPG